MAYGEMIAEFHEKRSLLLKGYERDEASKEAFEYTARCHGFKSYLELIDFYSLELSFKQVHALLDRSYYDDQEGEDDI